jgi:hypothetical protein
VSSAALRDLLEAYQQGAKLNEEALDRLQAGEGLENLETLFKAKEAVLELILKGQGRLDPKDLDPEALQATADAQALCARSEGRLAQVLGEQRQKLKNVSEVTEAYRSKVVDKLGTRKLDLET